MKLNNTKQDKLHNKAMRTLRDAAVLLLLHRLLRDTMMFCALEKIWEPMTTKTIANCCMISSG
jgi:hypothetical protein